jgi:hypothetical protein
MTTKEILVFDRELSFEEARAAVALRLRHDLRNVCPHLKEPLFEDRMISDKSFWLFFRSRKIVVPKWTGGAKYDWAYAIGKHGYILTVADNLEASDDLTEQVQGLSGHIALREQALIERYSAPKEIK